MLDELLVSVLLMLEELTAVKLSPVTFALLVAIQEKEALTLEVKSILSADPLQMAAVLLLVTTGVGLTVTWTVCPLPTQLPVVDVGVTV
jgi:hypothetical protein